MPRSKPSWFPPDRFCHSISLFLSPFVHWFQEQKYKHHTLQTYTGLSYTEAQYAAKTFSYSVFFSHTWQALSPPSTSTTCWSAISTTSRTSCRCMSCPPASSSWTCRWTWAQCAELAARRNTLTSSTSSAPSPRQVDNWF